MICEYFMRASGTVLEGSRWMHHMMHWFLEAIHDAKVPESCPVNESLFRYRIHIYVFLHIHKMMIYVYTQKMMIHDDI